MVRALRSRRFGPYTLQAAISAVHAEAQSSAATDWAQIAGLYDLLLQVAPSPVVEAQDLPTRIVTDVPLPRFKPVPPKVAP